jgi:raffinose synthase
MALHRLKWWWLAPTFVSDPRLLAGDNVLLLWRRMQGNEYHLLAPLAGGGMVGALRVSDFDQVRVAFSSDDANFTPQRIPLFVYTSGADPYQLAPQAYAAASAANTYYGRARWEKPYPDMYRTLGWCSWNAYGQQLSETKLLKSAESLKGSGLPIGYVIIDDGWLSTRDFMLAGYQADPKKFPDGLGATVRKIHDEYGIPHVGVWHTLQGYWSGVDPESQIGKDHKLFAGANGYALWRDRTLYLPDARDGAGESFYADWYKLLKADGIDFVKVDNQASTPEFTRGLLPVFDSSAGEQRNLQEAAREYFPARDASSAETGVNVINCMEMALEDAFNWRYSNVARNSEDYFPDDAADIKNHTFYNAYNSYWTSNFAYPDWDEFETGSSDAKYQAIGRAMSGGPVYFTGGPDTIRPATLRPLILSSGRLLMLDAPSMPARDSLLTDTSISPEPLKIFGTITRPGLKAGMVAAFNVDKAANSEDGNLSRADADGLLNDSDVQATVAIYDRSSGKAALLDAQHPSVRFSLDEIGCDLFTLVPANRGAAVFGLLDKYLGPAGVVEVKRSRTSLNVAVAEAGDLGAYLAHPPASVKIDGKPVPSTGYSYSQELLRIPRGSFSARAGEHEVEIQLADPQ